MPDQPSARPEENARPQDFRYVGANAAANIQAFPARPRSLRSR